MKLYSLLPIQFLIKLKECWEVPIPSLIYKDLLMRLLNQEISQWITYQEVYGSMINQEQSTVTWMIPNGNNSGYNKVLVTLLPQLITHILLPMQHITLMLITKLDNSLLMKRYIWKTLIRVQMMIQYTWHLTQ